MTNNQDHDHHDVAAAQTGHDHGNHDHAPAQPQHIDHDDHGHSHAAHGHGHGGRFGWLTELLPFGHSHGAPKVDSALEGSAQGIRALQISLVILGVTAIFQLAITLLSGSAALLTDTLHNFSDALTAVPLWIAFVFGRRAASKQYTYGYGRGEDLAGVVIVAIIFASALLAGYESVRKIIDPADVDHIGWVIAAAIAGFFGNEAVAIFRIRTGEAIGSAALVADGQHARADGLTSLAVLFGALGVLAGAQIADPIAGLLITLVILIVVKDSALVMWRCLMDAIDPETVQQIDQAARIEGVLSVDALRVRWLGHRLDAELHIKVDGDLPTRESHDLAEKVRHELFHKLPQLAVITVHVDPADEDGHVHELTAHHDNPK